MWAYVDLDSLVDFVLLQELLRNNDAYYLSVHMWRERGGRLHFVPWDLDLTLGQPSYNDNENPEGWVYYRPEWLSRMTSDPLFLARLESRWHELRADLLSSNTLSARIDRYQTTLEPGLDENLYLWPVESIQFGDDYLYSVESYVDEIEQLEGFLMERVDWMDRSISTY